VRSVREVVDIFKEIQQKPERLLEMDRFDTRKSGRRIQDLGDAPFLFPETRLPNVYLSWSHLSIYLERAHLVFVNR
jgi:hypothetical protein